MIKKLAVLFAFALFGANPVQAAIHIIHFDAGLSDFIGSPFGITNLSPPVSGNFWVDDALAQTSPFSGERTVNGSAFSHLNYVAGSKTFSDSDILSDSSAFFTNGQIGGFGLELKGLNTVYTNNTLYLGDGTDSAYCNFCVNFSSLKVTGGVPEPATWALMLGGFGLVGSSLRRRTKARALVEALKA